MHDIHHAFIQMAADKWNMTPASSPSQTVPNLVPIGTCEWCAIYAAASSPPNVNAMKSIFDQEPASIILDLLPNSLVVYAMSPIEKRLIIASNIPWHDDEFWSLGSDYLKFTFEIDKRYGKKNVESNFVRNFKRSFDCLDASWRNLADNMPTQQLTLTTLLRLIFIANIAERGALDGRKTFLFEAANEDTRQSRSIYRETLRPLFFETLNKPSTRRKIKAKRLGKIPFLNGGLFAPLPIETASPEIDVPNSTILSILRSLIEPYSWNTFLDEGNSNSIDDLKRRANALDPWMLGHIFETLMPAALRDSSGSYYTPISLAQLVVDRAFETWLGLQLRLKREDIRALFDRQPSSIPSEKLALVDKRLAQIRILDPAAGSGAFLQAAFERLLAMRSDIARALDRSVSRPHLAKTILTTNLYGIDVLPSATQICELRLWLELIRHVPHGEKLIPLPNLELNVSCGDALLDLSQWRRYLGISASSTPPHLPRLLRQFKTAHGYKKKRLRREIEQCSASISQSYFEKIERQYETAIQRLATTQKNIFESPRQSPMQKKWIAALEEQRRHIATLRANSMHIGFDVAYAEIANHGGFDLVIGNPPWFGLHSLPKETQSLLRLHYQCAQTARNQNHSTQSADISCLFVEKSLRFLNKDGCIAMLVPNKLFYAPSYKPFQSFLEKHAHLLDLHDWSQTAHNAFGAATYPASIILSPRENDAPLSAPSPWVARIELAGRDAPPKLALRVPNIKMRFDVRRGVCTGANDVYVCDRTETFSNQPDVQCVRFAYEDATVPIESSLIYDVLRGSDIRPYRATPKQCIVVPHHADLLSQPLRRLPPNANLWFERAKPRLDARKTTRTGLYFAISGASPTLNHKKVVWRDIAPQLEASYCDDSKTIPLNTVYYIPVQTDGEGYLLAAWLNSSYVRRYCHERAEHARNGYRRFFGWLIQSAPWPFDDVMAKPYVARISTLSRKAHMLAARGVPLDETLNAIHKEIDSWCEKCATAIERHAKPLATLRHIQTTPSPFPHTEALCDHGDAS